MSRVLIQTHAPSDGLAHLGTGLALGEALLPRGHTVTLAYGGALPELIERSGLDHRPAPDVPVEREWEPERWFESSEELAPVVDAHLALIEELRPEAIVACSGLAGRVAAEIAGVPVLHVYYYLHSTPAARSVNLRDDRLRDLRHPRRALRVLRGRRRAARRRSADRPVTRAVADLRRRRGLPDAPGSAIAGCPDSLVVAPTTPFLVPATPLPAHWSYVGPIEWAPPAPRAEPPSGPGPLAYVSQGSTGDPDLLRRSVAELEAGGFRVVATTAGLLPPSELLEIGPRVAAAKLLDGGSCMESADVAVIHAGHQTLMTAMRTGTPVVALPRRLDQIAAVHRIERLGIGYGLYPPPLRRGAIARTARRATDPDVVGRCRNLGRRLASGPDGVVGCVELVERLAARDPRLAVGR